MDYVSIHTGNKIDENITKVDNQETRLTNVENNVSNITTDLNNHETNYDNPHNVTAEQIGLGNVDNTSDLNKPISTATQLALNAKKNFAMKLSVTGLTNSLANGANLNIFTLLNLTTNVVYQGNILASDFSLTAGLLKTPNLNNYVDYDITVTLFGSFSGGSGTSRELLLRIRRADDSLVRGYSIVKVDGNDLSSRGTNISTYTTGSTDPYITNGFKIILENVSGQVLNLTGVELIIKGSV